MCPIRLGIDGGAKRSCLEYQWRKTQSGGVTLRVFCIALLKPKCF